MPLPQYTAQQQRLLADPRVQALIAEARRTGRGGRVPAVIDPRSFGITDLPPDIKFDPRAGQLVDNGINGLAEWGPLAAGTTLLGLGGLGAAGVGPLASDSAATAAASAAPGSAGAIDTTLDGASYAGGGIDTTLDGKTYPLGKLTANGSQSLADQFKDWLTPANLAKLAAVTGSAIAANHAPNPSDDPNIKALLEMSLKRQQRVDPLHDSVTRLAMAMLPTAYQQGTH